MWLISYTDSSGIVPIMANRNLGLLRPLAFLRTLNHSHRRPAPVRVRLPLDQCLSQDGDVVEGQASLNVCLDRGLFRGESA